MIEAGCTTVDDLRHWTSHGWEWRTPHPLLPNAYIADMTATLPEPPSVPAMLRQGQCWKLSNKVVEISACSPDLVHVTAWNPITTLSVFQLLSQGTTTQYPLHEFRNQLGSNPVKVFLSKSHPNGTKQILGTLNSSTPGSHLPTDHVLQHLEVIRDLPWSGPPLIYTDGSFAPTGGPLAGFCCPTETLHRGGGGIVLTDPSPNWTNGPVVCIHMEDMDNYLHAHSVFPYELGSIILALILSSLFDYTTQIHTDSKSSMDALLKPRKRVDSAREYYPLIAAGKSLLRSTGTVLRKIAAHPERTEPNHHRWSRHQWGNVLADRVAGDQPIQPRPQAWTEANVHHFRMH